MYPELNHVLRELQEPVKAVIKDIKRLEFELEHKQKEMEILEKHNAIRKRMLEFLRSRRQHVEQLSAVLQSRTFELKKIKDEGEAYENEAKAMEKEILELRKSHEIEMKEVEDKIKNRQENQGKELDDMKKSIREKYSLELATATKKRDDILNQVSKKEKELAAIEKEVQDHKNLLDTQFTQAVSLTEKKHDIEMKKYAERLAKIEPYQQGVETHGREEHDKKMKELRKKLEKLKEEYSELTRKIYFAGGDLDLDDD